MSQQPDMDQTMAVYSVEKSMANGNNGESTLQVVTPQAIAKLEMGLVPQMQAQPVAPLFDDRWIFVNVP